MMEERFGRSGRPMVTLMLLGLFIAVMSWAALMVNQAFLAPALRLIERGFGDEMLGSALSFGVGVLLCVPLFVAFDWFARRRIRKAHEAEHQELADGWSRFRAVLDKHRTPHERLDEIEESLSQLNGRLKEAGPRSSTLRE